MHNLHIRDARDTDREAIRAVTLSAYEEYRVWNQLRNIKSNF